MPSSLSLRALLTALVALSGPPALAASVAPAAPSAMPASPLDLTGAIALATERNPRIESARRTIEAAVARERQAEAWPNPNVSLIVDQVAFNNPGSGNYMAGVTQPLLPGGQREARVALAQADRELAELALATIRLDVATEAAKAFAELLYARDLLTIATQDADAGRELLKATRGRFTAGEVAKLEALRAEVESSRLERALAVARGREARALGRLNVLLGRAAQAPLRVAELPALPAARRGAIDGYLAQALAHRPELRRSAVAIAREALARRVAATSLWTGTEIMLLGGAVAGAPGFSSSVSMPIPIYRQAGEIAEAEANRRRAEAERADLANTVTLEVEEAYRLAEAADGALRAFRGSYLPQAERLRANARARFKAGEGSGVEVIEAARAHHETRAAYAEAVYDERIATFSLERAVGANAVLPAPFDRSQP